MTSAAVVEATQESGEVDLARTVTSTIAMTDHLVYFGDRARNRLLAVPKSGGPPIDMGGPNPLDVAARNDLVAWISADGRELLAGRPGARAERLATPTRGTFRAVAVDERRVYVLESDGLTGALLRADGTDVSRIASLDGDVREIALRGDHAFVRADSGIHRVPLDGSPAERIAEGRLVTGLAISGDHVYFTSRLPTSRSLVRVPLAGGETEIVATNVRNAPIAAHGEHVYFLHERDAALVRLRGREVSVAARAPALGWVVDFVVDEDRAYVAASTERGGHVLALPLRG